MAHDVAPFFLRAYGNLSKPQKLEWRPLTWRGLNFVNPMGIAGGVDKNADCVRGWWALGAGFVEVGTITPEPQGPNPGEIMSRNVPAQALWNRMGFPSKGIEVARRNLKSAQPFSTPVFVNIGKNRNTPNDKAALDYRRGLNELKDVTDAFVVNLSSPNTSGLRDLLLPHNLKKFLSDTLSERPSQIPVLLKLSPDMTADEIRSTLDTAGNAGVDGYILTNTTLSRVPAIPFPTEGGMSGAPLRELSMVALRTAVQHLGKKRSQLLISAGGIINSGDVAARLDAGADLVQTYSGLIYNGPNFFRNVHRELVSRV